MKTEDNKNVPRDFLVVVEQSIRKPASVSLSGEPVQLSLYSIIFNIHIPFVNPSICNITKSLGISVLFFSGSLLQTDVYLNKFSG